MIGAHETIVVMGRKGYGKTTVSRKIQGAFSRIVVVDVNREYEARYEFEAVAKNFEELSQAILKFQHRPRFKIVYQPDMGNAVESEFNEVCGLVFAMGNVLFVVEEVHVLVGTKGMSENFRRIIFLGRHEGVALLITSQRPARIHKDILSQADHIFAGASHEANDIKYLREVMGDCADDLKLLKKTSSFREFLWFRPGEEPETVKVLPKKN